MKAFKGLHKTFWDTTNKCENNNLSYFSLRPGLGWEGLNLYAALLSSKNKKSSMHLFFVKLEKLHFEPISGSFWVKNFKKQNFSSKKTI